MTDSARYGWWLRALHWLTALLVIGALLMIELHGYAPKGSALRNGMMYAHMQFGIAALLVFVPHLWVRLVNRTPGVQPPLPMWQKGLSHLVHWVLLLIVLVQPILGVLMEQAGGHSLNFLGIPIPTLLDKNKDTGHTLMSYHVALGSVMLYLALFHAVAAFWHQWGRRDTTMARMWFGQRN